MRPVKPLQCRLTLPRTRVVLASTKTVDLGTFCSQLWESIDRPASVLRGVAKGVGAGARSFSALGCSGVIRPNVDGDRRDVDMRRLYVYRVKD